MKNSIVLGVYDKTVDRESAYETLKARANESATEAKEDEGFQWGDLLGSSKKSSRSDSILESAAKSAARAVGSQLGRSIIRGVLGSLLGKK